MEQLFATYPFVSLMIAGQLGMVAHWLKRWMRDQTKLGAIAFFKIHGRATLGSMIVMVATIVGMIGANVIAATPQTLALAFLAGFNLNSVFTPHEEKPL